MRKSNVRKTQVVFKVSDYERPGITADEVQEIKESFDLFDTDLSGAINPRGIF